MKSHIKIFLKITKRSLKDFINYFSGDLEKIFIRISFEIVKRTPGNLSLIHV